MFVRKIAPVAKVQQGFPGDEQHLTWLTIL
jgi:hypothetical protein